MSERLTDEHLRDLISCGWRNPTPAEVRAMANELLALRAERAKPTPSDAERAREIAASGCDCSDGSGTYRLAVSAFASIRAEGSAERTKLEVALIETQTYSAFLPDALNEEISRLVALAQPAESGATECTCDNCEEAKLRAGAKP